MFFCWQLFDQETQLDWIIFHDVMATSKIYMRTLCPIRYEWVKDLLPKLHEVDVYQLSSVARNEMTTDMAGQSQNKHQAKRVSGESLPPHPRSYLETVTFGFFFF